MKNKTMKLTSLIFLLITNGFSQNVWLEETENSSLAIEFLKPSFGDFISNDLELGLLTSATFLSGRFTIGKNTKLLVELPIGHADIDGQIVAFNEDIVFIDVDESETTVGNPYFGFEIRNDSLLKSEFGIRLPATSDKNLLAASFASNTDLDRAEAFLPDVATALLRVKLEKSIEPEAIARFKVGPTLWFSTKDTDGEQFELFFDYMGQIGYKGSKLVLLFGMNGRLIVSESNLSLKERSFHQIGINASYRINSFRPGIHIRIPADEDLSDSLKSVFGINLMYIFN